MATVMESSTRGHLCVGESSLRVAVRLRLSPYTIVLVQDKIPKFTLRLTVWPEVAGTSLVTMADPVLAMLGSVAFKEMFPSRVSESLVFDGLPSRMSASGTIGVANGVSC